MFSTAVYRFRQIAEGIARYGIALLLVTSVGLNVSLSHELRASRLSRTTGILPGTIVPPISGVTSRGLASTIELKGGLPVVFYYFSASCGWCERNWSNVEALVRQTRGRYRVVGIAASADIPAAVKDGATPIAVLTSVAPSTLAAYGFRSTPQTVVVGQDGRVLKSWTGAYQGEQAENIKSFFGVQLPGLLPKPQQR